MSGLMTPTSPLYDIFPVDLDSRLLRNALPGYDASRGGLTIAQGPTLGPDVEPNTPEWFWHYERFEHRMIT